MAQEKNKLTDFCIQTVEPAKKINIFSRLAAAIVRTGVSGVVGAGVGAALSSVYMFLTSLTSLFGLSFGGSAGLFAGFSGVLGFIFAGKTRGGAKNDANKQYGAMYLLYGLLTFAVATALLVGFHALLIYTAVDVAGLFIIACSIGAGLCVLATAISEYLKVIFPDAKAIDANFKVRLDDNEPVPSSRVENLKFRLNKVINSLQDLKENRPAVNGLSRKFNDYYNAVHQRYAPYAAVKKQQTNKIWYGVFSKIKREAANSAANWMAGVRPEAGEGSDAARFYAFFEGPQFHLILRALEEQVEIKTDTLSAGLRQEIEQDPNLRWVLDDNGEFDGQLIHLTSLLSLEIANEEGDGLLDEVGVGQPLGERRGGQHVQRGADLRGERPNLSASRPK